MLKRSKLKLFWLMRFYILSFLQTTLSNGTWSRTVTGYLVLFLFNNGETFPPSLLARMVISINFNIHYRDLVWFIPLALFQFTTVNFSDLLFTSCDTCSCTVYLWFTSLYWSEIANVIWFPVKSTSCPLWSKTNCRNNDIISHIICLRLDHWAIWLNFSGTFEEIQDFYYSIRKICTSWSFTCGSNLCTRRKCEIANMTLFPVKSTSFPRSTKQLNPHHHLLFILAERLHPPYDFISRHLLGGSRLFMCMENLDDEIYTKTCAVSKWFRLNPPNIKWVSLDFLLRSY